jgi:hypothetical protein
MQHTRRSIQWFHIADAIAKQIRFTRALFGEFTTLSFFFGMCSRLFLQALLQGLQLSEIFHVKASVFPSS